MNEESKKEVFTQTIQTNTAIGGKVKEIKMKPKGSEITETLTEALNKFQQENINKQTMAAIP